MVMLELLSGAPDGSRPPRVNLAAAVSLLCDMTRILDWDDVDDTLSLLDTSYEEDIEFLLMTALDRKKNTGARTFAVEAISNIDLRLQTTAPKLATLLQDEDSLLRRTVAIALRECQMKDYDVVIPSLSLAIRDWHSYIGTQITVFSTLASLLGFAGAIKSLGR